MASICAISRDEMQVGMGPHQAHTGTAASVEPSKGAAGLHVEGIDKFVAAVRCPALFGRNFSASPQLTDLQWERKGKSGGEGQGNLAVSHDADVLINRVDRLG
eukprot:2855779-Rhodomonas_salina.1